MPASHRILPLDALRGLAALSVIAYHYLLRYDQLYHHPHPAPEFLHFGAYGVQLFFIISGFVILMSLDKSKSTLDFAVARFSRLYPAFWAALAATFLAVRFFHLPDGSPGVPWKDAAWNLTMMHKFLANAQDIDGVYWTLERELLFYILMAAIVAAGFRKFLLPLLAAIVSAGILRDLAAALYAHLPGSRTLAWALNLDYLYLFLLGITIYSAAQKWTPRLLALAALALLAALADKGPLHAAIVAALFLLVLAATRFPLPLLTSRPLLFFGAISYSLYLLHQNIGYIIIHHAYQLGFSEPAAIAAATTTAIALASALCFLIEKPANRTLRRLHASHQKPPTPLPPPLTPTTPKPTTLEPATP
ncbi:MAG TPA: acyltransferase [Phycisphaerae bacterium]|nr:acyltransferase [Phycisphaerae bacterium]